MIWENGTATENISAFLDFHLRNIVPTIPYILEDTLDLFQRVNQIGDIPENTLLVLLNVVGFICVEIMRRFVDKPEN